MDLALVLTHACNLACSYCYTGEKKQVQMPVEIAQRALDLLFDSDPLNGAPEEALQLTFFGGEPLLEMEQLASIAREARRRAAEASRELVMQMTTNGTLLTERRLETLTELGVHLALSLDGTRSQHDLARPTKGGGSSYAAVRAALERLLARGRPFDVISVVHPGNVAELHAGVRELLDLGVRALTLNIDWSAAWSEASLALLAEQYEWVAATYLAWLRRGVFLRVEPLSSAIHGLHKGARTARDTCGAGTRRLAVAPSGRIYGCPRSVGEDTGSGAIGDLGSGLRAASSSHSSGAPACSSCAASSRCQRHCACACREETGDPSQPGPVLCFHQHLVEGLASRLTRALLRDETVSAGGRCFASSSVPSQPGATS